MISFFFDYCDTEHDMYIISWNGHNTYNVYTLCRDTGRREEIDVFTNYHIDTMEDAHAEAKKWIQTNYAHEVTNG